MTKAHNNSANYINDLISNPQNSLLNNLSDNDKQNNSNKIVSFKKLN